MLIVAGTGVTWGQIWAPVVSTVLAATITGMFLVASTRNTRQEAKDSADAATAEAKKAEKSATTAQEVADLLAAKNEIIDQWKRTADDLKVANETLERRQDQLHEANERLEARCNRIQEQLDQAREELDEKIEALRNASLLERERMRREGQPQKP